jgi:hypothetical protein
MTTRDRCRRDRYRGARGWRNRHALVHALMTDLPQSTLEAMAKIRWDRDEQRTRIDPIPWDANEHQRKCAAGGARASNTCARRRKIYRPRSTTAAWCWLDDLCRDSQLRGSGAQTARRCSQARSTRSRRRTT